MKTIFTILLIVPSLLLATGLDQVVVKIKSECNQISTIYYGSGFLFQNKGSAYVLTSDHVLLHTNMPVTTQTVTSSRGTFNGKYLMSDWSKGIGLLSVAMTPSQMTTLPTLEQLIPAKIQKGTIVTAYGYPYASRQLLSFGGGTVENPSEPQSLFFDLPYLIHIVDSHGEFGMSGGPVLTSEGELVGILSYQDLMQPSKPTESLLLIPGKEIIQWLKAFLADPSKAPVFLAQGIAAQLNPQPALASGRLMFHLGLNVGQTNRTADFEYEPISETPSLFPDPDGYLPRIETFFKNSPAGAKHVGIEVVGFRKQHDLFAPMTTAFSSLIEFVRELQDPTLEPLVLIDTDPPFPVDVQPIFLQAFPFQDAIAGVPQNCTPSIQALCNKLVALQQAAQSGKDELIKPSDLETLMNDPEWSSFSQTFGSDEADQIQSLIQNFRKYAVYRTF